jgi:hypothetical protein
MLRLFLTIALYLCCASALLAQDNTKTAPESGSATPGSPPTSPDKARPAKEVKPYDPKDDCVSWLPTDATNDQKTSVWKANANELRAVPSARNLQSPTYFVPLGTNSDFILRESYKADAYYFAAVGYGDMYTRLGRIASASVPATSSYVQRGIARTGETLLNIDFRAPDDTTADLPTWQSVKLYVYRCMQGDHADSPAELSILFTSPKLSVGIAVATLALIYLFAVLAFRSALTNQPFSFRAFDPIFITSGADGRGSLANIQIFFFSLIVFALSTYIVAQTGVLSDISPTVLLLLGIAGVGSTAAKGVDATRIRLEPANASWLRSKGWLPPPVALSERKPSWWDLITTDGEFDVYRYQSLIFSVAVGAALIVAGVNELATFSIPTTLLGILGLSQAVYVSGKLVTNTSISDLNAATAEAIKASTAAATEDSRAFVANTKPDPKLREDYLQKARVARDLVQNIYSVTIPDAKL